MPRTDDVAKPLLILVIFLAGIVESACGDTPGTQPEDPRIAAVELLERQRISEALAHVEQTLKVQPDTAHRLGFEYLRGHLLLQLGRRTEALEAMAVAMASTPTLEPWGRFRMAQEQMLSDHPEVAAGLLAGLLGASPPPSLITPALGLLDRAILAGGDCRLLRTLGNTRFNTNHRRRLAFIRTACALDQGEDTPKIRQALMQLLEEKSDDDIALRAAKRLADLPPPQKTARPHLLIGLAFYHHREFEIAIHHLARTVVQLSTADDISEREAFECRYALARSNFWLGRHRAAANAFDALARSTNSRQRQAQTLYQKARSLELAGMENPNVLWPEAIAAFEAAYLAEPTGRWADAALIADMRLRWLTGGEDAALEVFEVLRTRNRRDTTARALLFLASSDLVRNKVERAPAWLAEAERLRRVSAQELDFWRGRLEESSNEPLRAVASYARALAHNPYHPLGAVIRERLDTPALGAARKSVIRTLSESRSLDDLYAAWLMVPEDDPRHTRLHSTLAQRLGADQRARAFVELRPTPTLEWPLWQKSLERPEEMLLGLGIFDEAASVVLRHFPVAQPGLALTGSQALGRSGAIRRSLYIAEVLAKRIPEKLPPQFLPNEYRELLYPLGYSFLILQEAKRQGVDPYLVAGIIREESRFDPGAFSGAAARGLTQFVIPTAREIAAEAEIGPIVPRDLERPEIAIALAAAYLNKLLREFDGFLPQAVAAYNAGEPQAKLWRLYCHSDEPAEYLTKVAFRETRHYLGKVLTSRAHYRELYAPR